MKGAKKEKGFMLDRFKGFNIVKLVLQGAILISFQGKSAYLHYTT